MTESCENCKYAQGPLVRTPDVSQYFCRRYPPHGHHPEWHNCFPLVPPTGQWCGEYKHGTPIPLEP